MLDMLCLTLSGHGIEPDTDQEGESGQVNNGRGNDIDDLLDEAVGLDVLTADGEEGDKQSREDNAKGRVTGQDGDGDAGEASAGWVS